MLSILRPTDGGDSEPPLSGVCGEHESNTTFIANLCFSAFGGPSTNHKKASPLHQRNIVHPQKVPVEGTTPGCIYFLPSMMNCSAE
jgi:hypothetical protein